MKSSNHSDKRHGLHEFGTVHGTTPEVRVNRLETRLTPLVPFPHRHDFHHLLLITAGRGWHEVDFVRHPVRPRTVFYVKPGQIHAWRLSADTEGYVVEFGDSALFERGSAVADAIDLRSAPDRLTIGHLFDLMRAEYEGQRVGFERNLRHYLVPLLTMLARSGPRVAGSARATEDPLIGDFTRLIEENFKAEHRVEFYATRLDLTPKALTMRLSRALGRSARALIQDRCLLEARRLLAYSDHPVSEVGYVLGFDDPNYFSRFFRTATGESPGKFRARAARSRAPKASAIAARKREL